MANTISLMSNVIRNVVSKERIRYKEGPYDLDLTYIYDNIIAMGYPAPGKLESIYRNSLTEVRELLEKHHGDHYKVYNLCLESNYRYNADKFHGRVAIFPFEDHNPPTIELIQQFCKDVDSWLKEDVSNVVAVHCKAGKGRTGTMICAYLLYSGLQKSADEALAWYDVKRTKDRKGVTIPSQRRYVQYFSNLVCSSVPYSKKILKICEIRFSESSLLQNLGTVQCTVVVPQDSTTENTPKTWTIDFQESCVLKISNPSLSVAGDIKFEFARKSSQKPFCHFWLNTFFVQNSSVCESDGTLLKCTYTLNKSEIDYVHKDRKHKLFSEDFKISILFEGEACFNDDKKSKKQPAAALETQDISTKIQYDTTTNLKNVSTASKRKQPNYKPLVSNLNNDSTGKDLKNIHTFKPPSITKSNLTTWQNGEINITSDTRSINDNKHINYDSYITYKQSSPKDGEEDWESGESTRL
ncbi:phosphatidylinositol 3,4,5-trisphosphate 3-phosphatase and dual-specificity protein phosphatase PTEN isoform X2 [Drosophila guanche]|uniref:Phosphatidylinositol 3,4,5-trisphosphate 3-phosphatase and dual-specificity protein phosphatase PTEN n=1 Tax=Drosophila guanche TaxID=7266 RepID=A0A3B0JH29_DROGU|nr:phosphatidylinositol 3,4,5-trisphosphate 3-phosphatase and dual-specificity protein phosphatase PTEN isoform X2 [Drosophila guanche]SPP81657.1 blast:Phosphatidylinositol 3%2C4%2C5-trisphosphate 3-phosphatase and dual-specificity protein [Drosophila guanche]